MGQARHGLQTTVLLFDTVVDQRVFWSPKKPGLGEWADGAAGVVGGEARPMFRWRESGDVEMSGAVALGDASWRWSNRDGVRVEFAQIEMIHARRGNATPNGDVGLLVIMLAMMVGLGQMNFLFRAWAGDQPVETRSLEPSPELIARLLKREFGGAETGAVARVQRPETIRVSPSFYLPAGSAGPLDRAGGGALADGEPARRPPGPEAEVSAGQEAIGKPQLGSEVEPLMPEASQPDGILGLQPSLAKAPKKRVLPPAVERFVGWGFHDWLDVAEADSGASKEMTDRLQLARDLMQIDPDQPFAILTVAYYAYLSENYELCRSLYARYIDLYPDDAAGWNNLALTYKRSGQYAEEERLYRRSLMLEPDNANTKNNLAVNLAHQGRFAEAEALMEGLNPSPSEQPYAELHRAKIAAQQGKLRKAQRHLKAAVSQAHTMDTFHHIEFRQDIRLDPSLAPLRDRRATRRLLEDVYGDDSPLKLTSGRPDSAGGSRG